MRLPHALLGLVLGVAVRLAAQDTHVILLGTGTPNPDPERMGPAVAVVSAGRVYLVDAGAGAMRRAAQAGLKMRDITRVFLTHLHSDHTMGLPDVIFTTAVAARPETLNLYGPPGTEAMVRHVMSAWEQDIDIRLHGGEPALPAAYQIAPHDVAAGEVYRDDVMRVVAFGVKHGAWPHAFGYRFEAKDKVIVISGDTTYCEELIKAARGCDILVHEVYSQHGWEKRTPPWRAYHAAFHTSAPDVGRIAAQVRPRQLVLYHQLFFGETPETLLAELRANYDGAVISAKDLDVVR